jgi:hypothetical protein
MRGLSVANQAELLLLLEQAHERERVLLAKIELLEKRIEELQALLKKNSKNSSKPPSSDQKGNSRKGVNAGERSPGIRAIIDHSSLQKR